MTEPPPIVPSVGDRTATVLANLHNGHHEPVIVVGQALEDAYRDGLAACVQAERARIIAELRHDRAVVDLYAVFEEKYADRFGKRVSTADTRVIMDHLLDALADHLEHQTTTPAHPGGS